MQSFFQRFLSNHVLANFFFVLVIFIGAVTYQTLPRQQDPTINFNWVSITTVLPGASAQIIEEKVTQPLEEGLENVGDIKFVTSYNRQNVSAIVIRFNDISEDDFDTRIQDVRRIMQSKRAELPSEASDPEVIEITSSNGFPSAFVVITSPNNDEKLRLAAKQLRRELNRLKRVDSVNEAALTDPQITIAFKPEKLVQYQLSINDLITSIRQAVQDVAAGDVDIKNQSWLVILQGETQNIQNLANIPIQTPRGEIPLSVIADVSRNQAEPSTLVEYEGKPAVMLSVLKKENENTLQLVEQIGAIVDEKNSIAKDGIQYYLADDQTDVTRKALNVMQSNFAIGLVFVLLVTWLFLGFRIALMTTIGIPFTVAGTIWIIGQLGFTLNTMVFLGMVIALGMMVDDAVVVVESIYYKMQQKVKTTTAVIDGIKEVIAPVSTSVLTTISAFLPLMLLPGLLGKFMLVVPLVVTIALLVSLIEAYWLLPSHVMMMNMDQTKEGRVARYRKSFLHGLRNKYAKILLKIMRYPKITIMLFILLAIGVFGGGAAGIASGYLKVDFFANDPLRLFYVNVKMPSGTPLDKTMQKVAEVETIVRRTINKAERRSIVAYAGQAFTETAPVYGKHYGQILVSLKPKQADFLSIDELVKQLTKEVAVVEEGTQELNFLTLAGGPPAGKAINMKILGDDYDRIRSAADQLKRIMRNDPDYLNVDDDDTPGTWGLNVQIDYAKARLYNIQPQQISQFIVALVDGVIIAQTLIDNEYIDIRLKAQNDPNSEDITDYILSKNIISPSGAIVPIRSLVKTKTEIVRGNILHYNFQKSITLSADIVTSRTDTLAANNKLTNHWKKINAQFPDLSIDSSGQFDDINESLATLPILFLYGLALMYLILGTQFRSYIQPLVVFTAIPLAFIGVVIGLLITRNIISVYTLIGSVALSGIAVNAAIVMVATANANQAAGMIRSHAIFYAAKRRIVPILITSSTTVAGLMALAIGVGGKSLLWGPIASVIVSGVFFSGTLSLLVIPIIYICYEKMRFFRWPRLKKASG